MEYEENIRLFESKRQEEIDSIRQSSDNVCFCVMDSLIVLLFFIVCFFCLP